ncbi:MAG: haloacid dehalogenase [Sulfuricurvum sp. RIFCSPLOWO2_02_FULL_43_45]|nr:MAG: haloacid dehalogenase [Sulfuricurvum sp. RIFCSPLOWO2_02_FULL_43_45]
MKNIALFDMDGTLIDSGLDITLSINHVRLECYDLEPLSVQAVIDAINAPVRNLAELFYGNPIYEKRARDLFERHYHDQCIQNVKPYEGIPVLLEKLHQNGYLMGVATNAPSVFAKRMLEHLGLNSYFRLIIGADEVESPKPHPQMLNRHLEHYEFRSGTDYAWMIGDNSKDMEAASRAGIPSVFAGWGFSSEGKGDYYASSPETLYDIICKKG